MLGFTLRHCNSDSYREPEFRKKALVKILLKHYVTRCMMIDNGASPLSVSVREVVILDDYSYFHLDPNNILSNSTIN